MIKKTQIHTEQPGRIISYFGNSVAVEGENGQVFHCHLRRNQALPIVGDWVNWQLSSGETGTITHILPRRTVLVRGNKYGETKPVAANLDILVIVTAPAPVFSDYLLDRYLVAAELLQIAPVVVFNKIDLLTEAEQHFALKQCMPYQHISYSVFLTSVINQQGLDTLRDHLETKTAALVGPSGVGKSSIIAALTGQAIRMGDVSAKGAGKHTTTATHLYHLPEGGSLIDSPGVREFNLWKVTKQELLCGFKEFKPYLTQCKFRDCLHVTEPQCAIQTAVANGEISATRYANYKILLKDIASD